MFGLNEDSDESGYGISMLIKIIVIFILFCIPMFFLYNGENIAAAMAGCAFMISAIAMNTIAVYYSITKITDKYSKESTVYNKTNYKRLKIHGIITIISIAILAIIGFLYPLHLKLINIKLGRFASMMILPFIFNIVFYLLLHESLHTGKSQISHFLAEVKEFVVTMLAGVSLPISVLIFLLFSILWLFASETNFVSNLSNVIASQVQYYDESYEDIRKSDVSVIATVENEMVYLRDVVHKDEHERRKLSETQSETYADAIEESYAEHELQFILEYLESEDMKNNFNDIYGLTISVFYLPSENKYDDTAIILQVFDYMYQKHYYYKFDLTTYKIPEEYTKKSTAVKMAEKLQEEYDAQR